MVSSLTLSAEGCLSRPETVKTRASTMSEAAADMPRLLERALAGDDAAMRRLVAFLEPIVRVRTGRVLMRRRSEARGRNLRVESEDFMQEVFAALFANRAKALRAWDPERGLSFDRFVGFLAEREVNAVLRTGRRSPWTEDPTMTDTLEYLAGAEASGQARVESRELLQRIAERMHERLSPLGLHYFYRLFVEQRSVASVAEESGATPAALYAWRSRLGRMLTSVRGELVEEDHRG